MALDNRLGGKNACSWSERKTAFGASYPSAGCALLEADPNHASRPFDLSTMDSLARGAVCLVLETESRPAGESTPCADFPDGSGLRRTQRCHFHPEGRGLRDLNKALMDARQASSVNTSTPTPPPLPLGTPPRSKPSNRFSPLLTELRCPAPRPSQVTDFPFPASWRPPFAV